MDYKKFLKKRLEDKDLKKEYDALQPEYQLIKAIVSLRIEKGMSQQDLSDLIGINRADISRIENGNANPSLKTMKRIAKGLGKKLVITFE